MKKAKKERDVHKRKRVATKANKIYVEGNVWICDKKDVGCVQGKRERQRRSNAGENAREKQ